MGPQRQARVPSGWRVYAVGDIHGCDGLLAQLHRAMAKDAASFGGERKIVYLGDYVDRGPDSRGVIDRLIRGLPGFSARHLKGNHDAALLDFLAHSETYPAWQNYGGTETLVSYGVRPPRGDSPAALEETRTAFAAALPPAHLQFLRDLELSVVIGDYLFVHAGIRPGIALDSQSEQDLLWIRDEFLYSSRTYEKIVVHGHTPTDRPVRMSNRIGVDTGAYATGILSCAVLEGSECRFLQAVA